MFAETTMLEPDRVPLTEAVTTPVVPPVAVKVWLPCAPIAPLVAIVTVTEQVPPAATAQVLAESEYGAEMPASVSDAAELPVLLNVIVPVAAVEPFVAVKAVAVLAVTATLEPVSVPLTDAVTAPVVPPATLRVCALCEPMFPEVTMLTVAVQVPPAAMVHVVGVTEYGAVSPENVRVAEVLPLLRKTTVPVAAAAPLTADKSSALLVSTAMDEPVRVPPSAAVTAPRVPPVAVRVRAV